MASFTHAVDLADTSALAVYTTAAFTPAAGDLLVVAGKVTGSSTLPTITSSDSLTFTVILSSGTQEFMAIADSLASAVSQTVSLDVTGGGATGMAASVERIAGMALAGVFAFEQGNVNAGLSGTTPSVTFGAAAQTNNPTYVSFTNNSNPAGVTEPTGWTEFVDTGYATPATGLETSGRDSGFTGTTITLGSNSATAWTMIAMELKAPTEKVPFDHPRRVDNVLNSGWAA